MQHDFSAKDYKRSRTAYTLECAFEYFVAILVADSFLAQLLTSLGFTDAQTGLIASLISVAFLFQLVAVPVVQRIRNVKRFSILFHFGSQLFLMSLYLTPFLPFAPAVRRVLAVGSILVAYFGNYLVSSVIYRWGNSFVDPERRALFSSTKEMISLASGVVVSLLFGLCMDRFTAAGELEKGFLFAAVGILIFSLCDFACLLSVKNETAPRQAQPQTPVRAVLRTLMRDKRFLYLVLLTVLWDCARYLSVGFLGTFKINDLLYTVGQVQLMNIAGSVARFALSRPFGRFSDKHSFAKGVEVALCIVMAAFALNVFTNAQTRWLMVGYTLLYNIAQAGLNANLFNMAYNYVDQRYFVQASAIKNSIGGLCGFGASLLGSRILAAVQQNGDQVMGIPMYGQQLLSALSILLLVAAVLLTHFVIAKQHALKQ